MSDIKEVIIRLTWRQADRVVTEMQNGADVCHHESDRREYKQIVKRFEDAIGNAVAKAFAARKP